MMNDEYHAAKAEACAPAIIGGAENLADAHDAYDGAQVALWPPQGGTVEQCANARLIAAAPSLLAALQAVADYWAGGDVPAEIDAQMRAAIASATGADQ